MNNTFVVSVNKESGLTILTQHCPFSNVDYFGIAVNAGSADEDKHEYGLAHFVEHCLFKGTKTHSANYILNRLERIGGELNAYTNKEETVVYSIAPAGNIKKSVALISDIIQNSIFPADEIDKERGVIIEEIHSYRDTPSEDIYDDVDEKLFEGTPLAHNILGTFGTIRSFDSEMCRSWLKRFFVPSNSVVFYSGPLSPDKASKEISKVYGNGYVRTPRRLRRFVCNAPLFKIKEGKGENHQCHVAMAFRIPGIDWKYQPEILLLCNMLAGPGMNSILNMVLREKKGWVYTVESSTSFHTDLGSLVIYFGCEGCVVDKCIKLIQNELKKLSERPVSVRNLCDAKTQYLGQLTIALENRESSIMSAARSLLCRGRVMTGDELKEKIEGITIHSLHEAAQWISPEKVSWVVLT